MPKIGYVYCVISVCKCNGASTTVRTSKVIRRNLSCVLGCNEKMEKGEMRGFVTSRGDYLVHQQLRSHFRTTIRSRILADGNTKSSPKPLHSSIRVFGYRISLSLGFFSDFFQDQILTNRIFANLRSFRT